MTESSRLFFTGNTLDQAVVAAATHYGIEPDQLAYERVERRSGFLRGRKRVVIRVDSDNPRLAAESPTPAVPAAPAAPAPPADPAALAPAEESPSASEPPSLEPVEAEPSAIEPTADEAEEPAAESAMASDQGRGPDEEAAESLDSAAEATSDEKEEVDEGEDSPTRPAREDDSTSFAEPDLDELPRASSHAAKTVQRGVDLLAALGDLDLSAEVYEGEDQLVVELSGDDQQRLVHGEGRLLLAIQHLLPRILHGITGEMTPCRVDSRGFRQKRVETLERIAERAAEEVRRSGRSKTLRSMNPADRRTVHLALEEVADVTTESEGHGFFKRITVRLV